MFLSLGSVLILILGGQAKATTHSVSRICLLFHFGRQFHHSSNCFSTRWKVDQRDSCAASYGGGADLCRRYALFTLVGIACGDDLDAPDLLSPTAPETKTDISTGNKKDRLNGGQGQSVQQGSAGHRAKASSTPLRPKLDTEASLALREQLIIELENISSSENAARWAHRIMGTKNTLTAADAERVEQAFQARLTGITTEVATEPSTQSEQPVDRPGRGKKRRSESVVDKSVLALPSPRRIRDRDHVKSVAKQPCLICGRRPADAHHLRFAQSPALGRKVSDVFTVPLCRGHHREVHRCGYRPDRGRSVALAQVTSVATHSQSAGIKISRLTTWCAGGCRRLQGVRGSHHY